MTSTRQQTPDQGAITAILGPTNTGKTHYAVERMLSRASGIIGLPLRLLAREIYDRICAARGASQVGKGAPRHPRQHRHPPGTADRPCPAPPARSPN